MRSLSVAEGESEMPTAVMKRWAGGVRQVGVGEVGGLRISRVDAGRCTCSWQQSPFLLLELSKT